MVYLADLFWINEHITKLVDTFLSYFRPEFPLEIFQFNQIEFKINLKEFFSCFHKVGVVFSANILMAKIIVKFECKAVFFSNFCLYAIERLFMFVVNYLVYGSLKL